MDNLQASHWWKALEQFKWYNVSYSQRIHTTLQSLGIQLAAHINAISPLMQPLVHQLIDQCEWGKKIRGTLIYLWYELSGWWEPADVDLLSSAIELFQTAILIHDDIIDQSPLRRGRPTIHHSLWGHYGMSQAICIGDIGFLFANKLITQLPLSDSIKIKLVQYFSDMVIATGTGEMLDICLPHKGDGTYQEIVDVMTHKTARYTIGYPLVLWAIWAWADQVLIDQLLSFGDAVGIAFQIADDVQWIFWSVDALGKPIVSDIAENKQTLLLRYAKDHATPEQLSLLQTLYGQTWLSVWQIDQIKEIFQQTWSVEYAREQIHEYLDRGRVILSRMDVWDDYKTLLIGLINMVEKSSK